MIYILCKHCTLIHFNCAHVTPSGSADRFSVNLITVNIPHIQQLMKIIFMSQVAFWLYQGGVCFLFVPLSSTSAE